VYMCEEGEWELMRREEENRVPGSLTW